MAIIKDILKEGFILKSKGYYKHAIEAFYKALELDSSSPELLLEIADVYYLMGEEERALGYISQILENDPAHINSLKLLKKIFINKNAISEAVQTAKNIYCISKKPKDLACIFRLLNKQGKFDEIFEYHITEETPEILYEKAYAKMSAGKPEEAEDILNQIKNPDIRTQLLMGKILFKSNKKSECESLLNTMPEDLSNPEYLNFAGLIMQYKKDYKTALKYFLEAVKHAPDKSEYYYNCASTYFKSDDLQMAKKYYNLAIALNPDNPNYHFALANLYYAQKHYKRALEELNVDLFEAKLLKSIILYDTGYFAIAKREMESLLIENPDSLIAKEYLARIETELKV